VDGDEIKVFLTGSGEIPNVPELEDALSEALATDTVVVVEHAPTVIIRYAD